MTADNTQAPADTPASARAHLTGSGRPAQPDFSRSCADYWHAVFVRTDDGTVVELDGVLLAEFDDAGRCRQFREWWHRR